MKAEQAKMDVKKIDRKTDRRGFLEPQTEKHGNFFRPFSVMFPRNYAKNLKYRIATVS